MAGITSSNVANAIVKLVAADALPALVGNLVMGNLVNRDYEPVLANAGDTVNVLVPPPMQANNILDGGSVQVQNPTIGSASIVLNTAFESVIAYSIDELRTFLAFVEATIEQDHLPLCSYRTPVAIFDHPCIRYRARDHQRQTLSLSRISQLPSNYRRPQ